MAAKELLEAVDDRYRLASSSVEFTTSDSSEEEELNEARPVGNYR